MAYTIVIASRYLIPLFLYLFLSCSIYALFVGDVRKQSGAAALQMVFFISDAVYGMADHRDPDAAK